MSKLKEPTITTIIPTFRRPKLLRRAILSVLNQTYPDFQVCVYDNASGDETYSVVAKISKKDSRVKYYCHPNNIGSLENFLFGMKQVDTQFFSFLSDDDILLPEFYETALDGLSRHPEAIFSATASIVMDDKGNTINSPFLYWKEGVYHPPNGLLPIVKYPLMWTSILFRRDVIEKVGLFDVEAGPPSDLDLLLRVAARYPFVVTQKPGAIYIMYPLSSHASSKFDEYRCGWLKIKSNLTEDERIPHNIREYSRVLLTKYFKRWGFSIWLKSVIQADFDDSVKAIVFLRDYCNFKKGWIVLYVATKICRHFSPMRYSLLFVRNIMKRNRRKGLSILLKQDKYAKLLMLEA